MCREIGGYLELERFTGPMLHEKALALSSGRACLSYLIEQRGIRKIALPDFDCDVVEAVCRAHEIDIRFYPVGADLRPKTLQTQEDEWFYLDTLAKDDGGVLTLRVALDGETQGNDYQDTLAELQMQFAVELRKPGENPPPEPDKPDKKKKTRLVGGGSKRGKVKTGDYTNYIPYLVAAAVSGLAFLLLAIYSLRERRRQRGGKA